MRDVQKEPPPRKIPIDKVGVEDVTYPIRVMDKENGFQNTVARIKMSVDLPHNFRGTHMSRFIEVLNKHLHNITLHNLENILEDIRKELDAETSHIEIEFPYFIKKKAPVSGMESFMNYRCKFIASKDDKFDFILEVNVPVHTLCPCSKEISERGAHNQRALVSVQVRMKKLVWIEEIVEMVEGSVSAPLYALLKREDERYITEHAYDNPRFVEDVVREVAVNLDRDDRIIWYFINVKSFESIHNHNAFACLKRDKIIGSQ
ncbi:MAG: GTP cyclohydrolase I FolE2 [Candidatus Hydrothermota bacterium]|nr:MAG: GTP cyclohydrolase I FolE2 [Candidatus Hydrothermae bacterium]